MQVIVQDFRPDPIIRLYWREVLDIKPTDELLEVEILCKPWTFEIV